MKICIANLKTMGNGKFKLCRDRMKYKFHRRRFVRKRRVVRRSHGSRNRRSSTKSGKSGKVTVSHHVTGGRIGKKRICPG